MFICCEGSSLTRLSSGSSISLPAALASETVASDSTDEEAEPEADADVDDIDADDMDDNDGGGGGGDTMMYTERSTQ